MKSKIKFLIITFAILLIFFYSICYATDTSQEPILISSPTNYEQVARTDSDLYISDSEYEINNTVNGNVFATVDNLTINSSGIINGNLFVTADNVTIKSDVIYSDDEKDELGNSALSINKFSSISRKRIYTRR